MLRDVVSRENVNTHIYLYFENFGSLIQIWLFWLQEVRIIFSPSSYTILNFFQLFYYYV